MQFFELGPLDLENPTAILAGVDRKKEEVTTAIRGLEEERSKPETQFNDAWEGYQDSRAMVAMIKEIERRTWRCVAEHPAEQGDLAATWIGHATQRAEESWARYCSSGRFLVDFDDAGNAIEGRIALDCWSVRAKIQGESSYDSGCELDTEQRTRVANIEVDRASGRISGDVVLNGETVGRLSGTVMRSGDVPPYSYSGQGTFGLEETEAQWRTGAPLSCLGGAPPPAD